LKTARQIADSQQPAAAIKLTAFGRSFLFGRPLLCAAAVRRSDDGWIRKSSSFFPDLSCAVDAIVKNRRQGHFCAIRRCPVSDEW